MTDPTEAEMVTYMRSAQEAEKAGARQSALLGPFTTLVMIGALQLAIRHPSMDDSQRKQILSVIDGFRPWFADTLGEQIIDMGNNPELDR